MLIGVQGIYHLLFVCNFVCKYYRNGYLWHGLIPGDEIWQGGKSGWVAGHLPFSCTLAQDLAPRPESEKW